MAFSSIPDAPAIAPKLGKRYVMRNGQKTGPMQPFDGPSPKYQWMTAERVSEFHASAWTAEGNFFASADHVSQYDIVAEVIEPAPIPPQAGKTYRMRNGETVGPMRFREDDLAYPWIGYIGPGEARMYTPDGRHYANPRYDIVAEIAPDADAPTAEGPVRRRMVTEIVPGVYGRVQVNGRYHRDPPGEWVINLTDRNGQPLDRGNFSATELRAAAAVLIALADGLDEIGGGEDKSDGIRVHWEAP